MPARVVLVQRGMMNNPIDIEALTEKIIGCGIEVHRVMGPGLLESVYRDCMLLELRARDLTVECGLQVPLDYKGARLNNRLKLDLLVEDTVIVELKAVERSQPIHLAQIITYLKLTGCPAGLLMNFHSATLVAGLNRLTHPDLYVKKPNVTDNPTENEPGSTVGRMPS
jgi:GxxExxY protein